MINGIRPEATTGMVVSRTPMLSSPTRTVNNNKTRMEVNNQTTTVTQVMTTAMEVVSDLGWPDRQNLVGFSRTCSKQQESILHSRTKFACN